MKQKEVEKKRLLAQLWKLEYEPVELEEGEIDISDFLGKQYKKLTLLPQERLWRLQQDLQGACYKNNLLPKQLLDDALNKLKGAGEPNGQKIK